MRTPDNVKKPARSARKKFRTLSTKRLLELRDWLDEIYHEVEVPEYIPSDPVSFMHAFEQKEDQLLAGFFAAIMAWGRRDIVLNKVNDLLNRMNYQPEEFIRNFDEQKAKSLNGFKHRTFTDTDVYWLVRCLQNALIQYGSFEDFWMHCYRSAQQDGVHLMEIFHDAFFSLEPETPRRTRKHIASKKKKSSCKRLWLFLRWAVRKNSVVDLGLMNFMPPSELMIPFDVHVARQARRLGLLSRPQNDWSAVEELHNRLRQLDPHDPAKYDYALFGIGVLQKEIPEEYIINNRVD
ncbi:MAG: TIGR02757 family protein [Bacteroidetes bacterium]|nr:TIGR02757 family protein [Bacteroidota bacterium]MCH8523019.1 TIGR02757 family protein [Balneolales bacterium]